MVLEKKSFKVKVDARQTDAAPCHKLTWPFGPGELIIAYIKKILIVTGTCYLRPWL